MWLFNTSLYKNKKDVLKEGYMISLARFVLSSLKGRFAEKGEADFVFPPIFSLYAKLS